MRRELEAAGKASVFDDYKASVSGSSNSEARLAARNILGKDVFWDWDLPRTKEGFYHTSGGTEVRSTCFMVTELAYNTAHI